MKKQSPRKMVGYRMNKERQSELLPLRDGISRFNGKMAVPTGYHYVTLRNLTPLMSQSMPLAPI